VSRVFPADRRLGYFPEPDAHGPSAQGRPAPLWKRIRRSPGKSDGVGRNEWTWLGAPEVARVSYRFLATVARRRPARLLGDSARPR
jgi:hypothetical protein